MFGTQVQKERLAKAEKGKEMGKRLAMLVEHSSPGMKSIYDQAVNLKIAPDRVFDAHNEMKKLAEKILRED